MENQGLPSNTVLFASGFDPLTKSDAQLLRFLNQCSKQEGFKLIIVVVNRPLTPYVYDYVVRIDMAEAFVITLNNPLVSVVGYSENFLSPSEIAFRLGARDCMYGVSPARSWEYLRKRFLMALSDFFFPKVRNFLVKGERKSRVTLDTVHRAIARYDCESVRRMIPKSAFEIIWILEDQKEVEYLESSMDSTTLSFNERRGDFLYLKYTHMGACKKLGYMLSSQHAYEKSKTKHH